MEADQAIIDDLKYRQTLMANASQITDSLEAQNVAYVDGNQVIQNLNEIKWRYLYDNLNLQLLKSARNVSAH